MLFYKYMAYVVLLTSYCVGRRLVTSLSSVQDIPRNDYQIADQCAWHSAGSAADWLPGSINRLSEVDPQLRVTLSLKINDFLYPPLFEVTLMLESVLRASRAGWASLDSREAWKAKQSHCSTRQVSRTLIFPDFKTLRIWEWWGCQPYAPAAFNPPRNIPGTHFC